TIPFFCILNLLPHISTLFPYTTLFRSHLYGGLSTLFPLHLVSGRVLGDPGVLRVDQGHLRRRQPGLSGGASRRTRTRTRPGAGRSEEHTSELQSLAYLVCRLLLEKKKI